MKNIKWPTFIIALVIETWAAFFTFAWCYPLLAALVFGTGANSFLYSSANRILWIALPVLIPSAANFALAYGRDKEKDAHIINTAKLIQTVLLILYAVFIICVGNTRGFTI